MIAVAIIVEAAQLRSQDRGVERFRKHLKAALATILILEVCNIEVLACIAGASTEVSGLKSRIEGEVENVDVNEVIRMVRDVISNITGKATLGDVVLMEILYNVYPRLYRDCERRGCARGAPCSRQ